MTKRPKLLDVFADDEEVIRAILRWLREVNLYRNDAARIGDACRKSVRRHHRAWNPPLTKASKWWGSKPPKP
jgi:hypothetical protein